MASETIKRIMNAFVSHDVCILVGQDSLVNILAIADIAWEMLIAENARQAIFVRNCKGFENRTIHLKYCGGKVYFPEMDMLYQFFRQKRGIEPFLEWIQSETLVITSLEKMETKFLNNSILILDRIEEMDLEVVKRFVEGKAPSNKIFMTYCPKNMAFADIVIEEINQVSKNAKNGSVYVSYLQQDQVPKIQLEGSQVLSDILTGSQGISEGTEITAPILIKGREIGLTFYLKEGALILKNPELIPGYAGSRRFCNRHTRDKNVIHLNLEEKEAPNESEKEDEAVSEKLILPDLISHAEGQEQTHSPAEKSALDTSYEVENALKVSSGFWESGGKVLAFEALNEENPEHLEVEDGGANGGHIEVEEVQSPYWGRFKTLVFKESAKVIERNLEENLLEEQSPHAEQSLHAEKKDRNLKPMADSKKKYIVGKISGEDLFGADHSLIVKKGELITAEIVDRAEEAGRLVELIIHMTLPGLEG